MLHSAQQTLCGINAAHKGGEDALKQLVDLPLEDVGSITVAVDDAGFPSGPVTRGARQGEMVTTPTQTFEHALADVGRAEAGVIAAHPSGEPNFPVILNYGDEG